MFPKQQQVWEHLVVSKRGERTLLGYGGSMGSGKSACIVLIAWLYALQNPGCNIAICRNTLTALKTPGGTIDQFYKLAPNEGRTVEEGGVIVKKGPQTQPYCSMRMPDWPEGVVSTVYFRGILDARFFGSSEFSAILIDEASDIAEHSILYVLTRLRQRLADGKLPKYLFLTASNPYLGWFKDWFIDGLQEKRTALNEIEGIGKIEFIPGLQSDNPFLDDSYGQFQKAVLPEEMYNAMGLGKYDSFEGQVFPNFSARSHALYQKDTETAPGIFSLGLESWPKGTTVRIVLDGKSILIPRFTRVVGGLDFAGVQKNAHLSTGTVAVILPSGVDVVIDSFGDNGPGVFERQIAWMDLMQKTLGQKIDWTADNTQPTGIAALKREGFVVRPNNGKNDSWRESATWLRSRFMFDDDGYPKSMYLDTPNNRKLAKQISEYRVKSSPNADGSYSEKPIRVKDDYFDAYRYMHEYIYKIQVVHKKRQELPFVERNKKFVNREQFSEFSDMIREAWKRNNQ